MKYDASQVRVQSVESTEGHNVESQEVIELSVEMLGQVGGGGVVLNE